MIVGDNINIPSASKIFATTRSNTINGTNIKKLISNAVLSSETIYAGAASHMVISSGDTAGLPFERFTKNSIC